ncbi:zinc-binding metallopeptidase family protein [Niveispirillum sp. KHB5.9]|uniref:zinc-binding metallopeptidase family protein n=1 Tax=Niveispirillum sp. KHB5.9 TaxID=3400269 RepID=UPI003A85CE33
MKLFQCQCCAQALHFENTSCLRCGRSVGYLAQADRMAAVEADGACWLVPGPEGAAPDGARWRFCRNWELSACNWMVPVADGDDPDAAAAFCPACRHNRTVPDLTDPVRHAQWQKIEAAKRRLVYTIHRLGLPHPAPGDGHPEPLVFDFLADDPDAGERVTTGHDSGVVTIALKEADDAAREKTRLEMGEAYRTLLGHFRHEVGHYYWDLLARDTDALAPFRTLFGDERQDYGQALDRHYREGPPPGWQDSYVSAYATMHPWEDWAETWAHYLHMVDTLESAGALGMRVEPAVDEEGELSAAVDFDPYRVRRAERLLSAWVPLTVALNTLNRSMGMADLYPFALTDPVQRKLGFIHDLVRGAIGKG